MMANSEDNAELRARVMASLKKFEKIPESASPTHNQPGPSTTDPSMLTGTRATAGNGSGIGHSQSRKKRYRFTRPGFTHGYGAGACNQGMMSNPYGQAPYYSQYSPYMNQPNQPSYGYPLMMGAPQPFGLPQQPFSGNVPMDGFNSMYGGRLYPDDQFIALRRRRHFPMRKPKSSRTYNSRDSDTGYSTEEAEDERMNKGSAGSSERPPRKFRNAPRFASESIDLTMDDVVKCKPENYMQNDVVEPHIVDVFPMSAEKDPQALLPEAADGNAVTPTSNLTSLRYKLLSEECEKQNVHLLEAQENVQRIASAIRIQQLRLNESTEINNVRLEKIEKMQQELAKERELYEVGVHEERQMQQAIDDLNYQLSNASRLVNTLNENVIKKRVFMSQLQVQEGKSHESPAEFTAKETESGAAEKGPASDADKSIASNRTSGKPDKSEIMKRFFGTKTDYHQKLVEAYQKVLENKLLLFKTRKCHIGPFDIDAFIVHIGKLFNEGYKRSTVDSQRPSDTFDIFITDSANSASFPFGNVTGLADINESFGIVNKDDDYKLEEYLIELIFYFFLLNDENLSAVKHELLSIASNGTFATLDAVEKFSRLLASFAFHPHIFKEKSRYVFSPFVQSNFVWSLENIKSLVSSVMPRFFSSRVVMYLSSPRNIDNSPFLEDSNEFELLLESDPDNVENWINYAFAVLPTDMTLGNINAFGKDCLEKCLSIFSRALEARADCDELWICYLDFFAYHCAYDVEELADMYTCAQQYFSSPLLVLLMHVSHVADLNTKIALTKHLLTLSWEKIDFESTARTIVALILIYQNAKYRDCGESLIYALFFNEFIDMSTLMHYDDTFATLPESFQHKSFVNTFFTQTEAAQKIKSLLWTCAIHFLIYGFLPASLFFDYPYEHFADLSLELFVKLDHANIHAEKGMVLKQSKYALEYLMHENETNAMLKANFAQLSNSLFTPSTQPDFALNQAALNSSVEHFNQEYANFIKHFIPTYDVNSANFASINRIIQRSLGTFNDFERITTSLPLQKNDPLAWINYFMFLVKNKTSSKDMEKFFEDALCQVSGASKVFVWQEYVSWSLLTQSSPRIHETLQRFLEETIQAVEVHPSLRPLNSSSSIKIVMFHVITRLGNALDENKKMQILAAIPAELLPSSLFFELDTGYSMQTLLGRIADAPTDAHLTEVLSYFVSHFHASMPTASECTIDDVWGVISAALGQGNPFTSNESFQLNGLEPGTDALPAVHPSPMDTIFGAEEAEYSDEDSDHI